MRKILHNLLHCDSSISLARSYAEGNAADQENEQNEEEDSSSNSNANDDSNWKIITLC